MSPIAMPASSDAPFFPFFEALRVAPTAPGAWRPISMHLCIWFSPLNAEAKGAADRLAREVSKTGLQSLE